MWGAANAPDFRVAWDSLKNYRQNKKGFLWRNKEQLKERAKTSTRENRLRLKHVSLCAKNFTTWAGESAGRAQPNKPLPSALPKPAAIGAAGEWQGFISRALPREARLFEGTKKRRYLNLP